VKTYKHCQSCGIPLKRDPQNGGTNEDGTKSLKYCSSCYVDGVFTNPEVDTAKKMQSFVKEKLKEMGFKSIIARILTLGIPFLERWKKK